MRTLYPKGRTIYFKGKAHYRAELIFGILYLLLAVGWIVFYMTTEEELRLSLRLIGWICLLLSILVMIEGVRGLRELREDRMRSYGIVFTRRGTIFLRCLLIVCVAIGGVILTIDGDLGYQEVLGIFSTVVMGSHPLVIAIVARAGSGGSQEPAGLATRGTD